MCKTRWVSIQDKPYNDIALQKRSVVYYFGVIVVSIAYIFRRMELCQILI